MTQPTLETTIDPFNHYNTDVVKFDANHSQPDEVVSSGDEFANCEPEYLPFISVEALQMSADAGDTLAADAVWSVDSINVMSSTSAFLLPTLITNFCHHQLSEQVVHGCHLHCRTTTALQKVCWT